MIAPPQSAGGDRTAAAAGVPRPGRSWGIAYRTTGAAFVLTQISVGVASLGFHVTMSRMLGPAGYGELVSLLAVVTMLTVPAMIMQTIVAARTVRREALGALTMVRRAAVAGASATCLLLVAAPVLRDYLSLRSAGPIWCWPSAARR